MNNNVYIKQTLQFGLQKTNITGPLRAPWYDPHTSLIASLMQRSLLGSHSLSEEMIDFINAI